jgi:competence ComEA-like helix-hairpin-helix protein
MTKAAMGLAATLCLPAIAQDSGKALVERVCTKCHNLEATSRQHNTRERWAAIVDDMVSRGMEASDAEIEKAIDYLARTQGVRLNVNKATAEELAGALNVPASTASAIIAYRAKAGPFKSFDELKRVPALNGKDIESKKDSLDFSQPK